MRIEGGRFGGRPLLALPRGIDGLRPTSARVRGAIFDRLQNFVADCRAIDLFAGSGALGFEAISRGARWVTFIERHPRLVRRIHDQARGPWR